MWKTKWKLQEEETGGTGSSGGDTSFIGVVTENSSPLTDSATDSTESGVNWGDVAGEFLSEDGVEVEGDLEVVGAEPEVVEPVPGTDPAVPPVAPSEEVTAPVPPVTPPAAPIVPESAPAVVPADYQAWRETRLGELAGTYAISNEDAASLLTEPEVVLPRLMANAHMMVLESAMRAMQAMVPVMLQQTTQAETANNSARSLFGSINPDLMDARYEPAILQFGEVFRKVNPTAGPEEASRAIGALVRSALNITAPGAQAAPSGQAAPRAPTPFSPARGSGGSGGAVPSGNPFEAMANEFLQDD